MREFQYKLPTQNCQSFVIDILWMLRQWDPAMIPMEAIQQAQKQVAPTVNLTSKTRQKNISKRNTKHGERVRPRFTSSNGEISGIDIDVLAKHQNARQRVQKRVAFGDVPALRADAKPVRRRPVVMSENQDQYRKMPGAWAFQASWVGSTA
jgi:hypothetical protein